MSHPSDPGRGGLRIVRDDDGAGETPAFGSRPATDHGDGADATPRAGAPAPVLRLADLAPAHVEPPAPGTSWTEEQADAWLAARDLAGWRFALDRIVALLHELGDPHQAVASIHVVGTNGKSSTTRMIAALLQAHGMHPGAFLSPHLAHLRERIEVDGAPISEAQHAGAVAAVARAATRVDRPGDPVTQFEAHTAAAFVAMAEAACDVYVVEAGLGGRLDATNVLGAPVVALTSVDLDHTELLGGTIAEITAEKVAVVTEGATLVLGPGLAEEAIIVARDHAARVGAQVVTAKPEPLDRKLGAGYQAENYAVARAVCETYRGGLDLRIVREVAAAFTMPARFETLATAPTTILDGAHNPAGARALAAALGAAGHERGGVAVMSVFADKDVAGIVEALGERCDRFVLTDCGSPRAMRPADLAEVVRQVLPGASTVLAGTPLEAVATARGAAGRDGFVVICGTLALAQAVRSPTETRP